MQGPGRVNTGRDWAWVIKGLHAKRRQEKLLKGKDKPRIMHQNKCLYMRVYVYVLEL